MGKGKVSRVRGLEMPGVGWSIEKEGGATIISIYRASMFQKEV